MATRFTAQVRSSDASSGVAIPIYKQGNTAAYTLADNEYLEISGVSVVTSPGGDVHVFAGEDATAGTAETIARGDFAETGGVARKICPAFTSTVGGTLWVVAPAGTVDVQLEGVIRTASGLTTRPTWKENNFGQ